VVRILKTAAIPLVEWSIPFVRGEISRTREKQPPPPDSSRPPVSPAPFFPLLPALCLAAVSAPPRPLGLWQGQSRLLKPQLLSPECLNVFALLQVQECPPLSADPPPIARARIKAHPPGPPNKSPSQRPLNDDKAQGHINPAYCSIKRPPPRAGNDGPL